MFIHLSYPRTNTPFPSSKNSHFENEAMYKTFPVSFTCMKIKNHFHINGFAISLAVNHRHGVALKWSIVLSVSFA